MDADGRLLVLGALAGVIGLARARGSRGVVRSGVKAESLVPTVVFSYCECGCKGSDWTYEVVGGRRRSFWLYNDLRGSYHLHYGHGHSGTKIGTYASNQEAAEAVVRTLLEGPAPKGSRGVIRRSRSVVKNQVDLHDMRVAYARAALWSSVDDNGHPMDDQPGELTVAAVRRFTKDCRAFVEACDNAGLDLQGLDASQIGHDFWLTRNHHGTGFWDRGLGEIGQQLTELANKAGECHLFVSSRGKINAE